MPKKPQAYYRPQSLSEALSLLAQPHTVALAGGTQLLASEEGLSAAVVDLQALGLDEMRARDDRLQVGAMATLDGLASYLAREHGQHPATLLLAQVIKLAGPNTYRNAATVGGIVASRLADSEFLAALLVLGAEVHFADPAQAAMDLRAYLAAPEPPAGLITALHIPWPAGVGATERVARTPADYPIVAVVAWKPEGGEYGLAATGIAARPRLLEAAQAALAGELDEGSISAAAEAARASADHPGDFRGDAAYRADMAAVLTRRVLRTLLP